jgi:hypothetical protein
MLTRVSHVRVCQKPEEVTYDIGVLMFTGFPPRRWSKLRFIQVTSFSPNPNVQQPPTTLRDHNSSVVSRIEEYGWPSESGES